MNSLLTAATKRHVAPIIQIACQALISGATSKGIQAQGTLTFVSWAERIYGITNQHVLASYRQHNASTLCVAFDKWEPLQGKLRYVGGDSCVQYPFDLAIFEWSSDYDFARTGRIPIDLPALQNTTDNEELVLVVGYPGVHRKSLSDKTMEHGLYHIGCYAGTAGADNMPLRLNQSGLDANIRLGGVSGGPVLRVHADCYSFAGILYEGLGPADLSESPFGTDVLMGAAIPLWGERLEELIASGCR